MYPFAAVYFVNYLLPQVLLKTRRQTCLSNVAAVLATKCSRCSFHVCYTLLMIGGQLVCCCIAGSSNCKVDVVTLCAVSYLSSLIVSYTVVDNLKPTEIVVSFSALCHWNDPIPALQPKEESKGVPGKAFGKERGDRESRMDFVAVHEAASDQPVAGEEPVNLCNDVC